MHKNYFPKSKKNLVYAAMSIRKVRLTVVTSYFPIEAEPYRGHSAYQTLRCMTDWADIQVLCPLAVYPSSKALGPRSFRYARANPAFSTQDLNVRYVDYPALPLITRPFNGWVCRNRLYSLLKTSNPDIVLNYWLYPEGYAAVKIARTLNVPAVVGAIGSDLKRITDPFTRAYTRIALTSAAAVITVSSDLTDTAVSMGATRSNCHTIVNGCDTAIFKPQDRLLARKALGLDPDADIILYVGSLLATKGLNELFTAFRGLAAKRSNLTACLIGTGPLEGQLAASVQRYQLERRFRLIGKKTAPEVAQWLAASNLLCLPSYSEGCPNVVLEALACGQPVVATHVGGIPALIDRDRGVLVEPRQSEALERALMECLETNWDKSLIASRSQRSWKAVAADTIAVLESALTRRQRPNPHQPETQCAY